MSKEDKVTRIPERIVHYDHYQPGKTKPLDKAKTGAASAPKKQENKK